MNTPDEATRPRNHVVPLTLAEANALVARLHRHHRPVTGHRFSIGLLDEHGVLRGAAIIGRPVARAVDWHTTAEVTRLVTDGTPNACSMLYAAAARAAKAMGYRRIQTYTLATEPGTSLRAAGWRLDHLSHGRAWNCPTRARADRHPTGDKHCWTRDLTPLHPEPQP